MHVLSPDGPCTLRSVTVMHKCIRSTVPLSTYKCKPATHQMRGLIKTVHATQDTHSLTCWLPVQVLSCSCNQSMSQHTDLLYAETSACTLSRKGHPAAAPLETVSQLTAQMLAQSWTPYRWTHSRMLSCGRLSRLLICLRQGTPQTSGLD